MHTKTHEHIYGCVRSRHIRRDTIFTEFRGWKLTISKDFVWRTHILLLDPRGILTSLRSSQWQWLCIYTFTYAYIATFSHHHFTTNGNYHNTILPRQESWCWWTTIGLWQTLERPKNLWILEPFPFHLLLNEASTVMEPLDVGQTVAFLAADG